MADAMDVDGQGGSPPHQKSIKILVRLCYPLVYRALLRLAALYETGRLGSSLVY